MPPLLLVMAGGAIGSGARYLAGVGVTRAMGPGYPYGTLFVNLAGGLLMGLLVGGLARADVAGEPWRLLLGVGVLGGFTTFSSFSLETYMLLARGEVATAAGYIILSVVASVAMLALGIHTVRALA
ncbi:fluoride efflux transporter CrcB [Sphingomonas solaris]|uniref:Fluoride-specific ion channel FluC n=1 Tax=Alterirhizorhabdus solaris TaxID=2529389 RepID=A0A558QSK9_9SPHN|nr:fluoride efflux transporter CrcB [Sphingomonas solaris]TVV70136.1 fluoride efflux transporter CrcB [Sphingomonas solaris]